MLGSLEPLHLLDILLQLLKLHVQLVLIGHLARAVTDLSRVSSFSSVDVMTLGSLHQHRIEHVFTHTPLYCILMYDPGCYFSIIHYIQLSENTLLVFENDYYMIIDNCTHSHAILE